MGKNDFLVAQKIYEAIKKKKDLNAKAELDASPSQFTIGLHPDNALIDQLCKTSNKKTKVD